jgi:hypothetical protein
MPKIMTSFGEKPKRDGGEDPAEGEDAASPSR